MNKISGFAWHCHHELLFEWVTDYDERVKYIKEYKPKEEQELRLKLFRMIPINRIPKLLDKAREAYDKAGEAYDKAMEAYDKAGEACDKAREAYDKAGKAYYPKMEKLHKELCPNCTWDGRSIFGEDEDE